MKVFFSRYLLLLSAIMLLLSACTPSSPIASHPAEVISKPASDVVVSGAQWGKSTCFIGATEGSSRFAITDLQDLGINAYHVYGGMSRWEAQDDSEVYGLPTIDQIKADPNVINWSTWDARMTNPPDGSDYWWTYQTPAWHGNARTLLSSLLAAHIRPILTLRNQDNLHNPAWIPSVLTTQSDWNEWWEHVFATVYWLNVRNNYNVNDFEVHNEPNLASQGWMGTEAQYLTFLQDTHDAIAYVYKTYLPGRTFHIYAPATSTGSSWPRTLLQQASLAFDSLDIHDYDANILARVQQVHQWLNTSGHSNYPVWLSEWGSYLENEKYTTPAMGISLINNLMRGSMPGDAYVYGNTIFSLYDYGTVPFGLIHNDGSRRADYYALRMAIRALQGCRPTYQSAAHTADLLAMTTRDTSSNIFFLVTNQNTQQPHRFSVDLSALISHGTGSSWRFDALHSDQAAENVVLKDGRLQLQLPANGALLIKFPHRS